MQKHLALMMLAAVVATASAQDSKITLHVGDPAPPLVIAKWAKGQPVKQLGHGSINVVEFWATWCGPCKQSIPHLTELAKKYHGKATFIGVDSFEHIPDAATCYTKVEKAVAAFGNKMEYNVAIDDVDGTMGKTWMEASGQNGIPTAFVIDKTGKVVWIGHPMAGLDEVVGKVIDGTFDAKAEAEKQNQQMQEQAAAQQKQQKLLQPILDAIKAKDYKEEVVQIDKLSDSNPEWKPRLLAVKFEALAMYDGTAAQKFAADLADTTYKGNAQGLNSLAWEMVKDDSPIKHLDTALAVNIAEAAYKASGKDPMIADTLALAYFRANRISDAYDLQKKAIAKASSTTSFDAATLTEMKGRLQKYEKALNPTDKGG